WFLLERAIRLNCARLVGRLKKLLTLLLVTF
ncbi:hypothetical protein AVDCRST_MAG94-1495, partial [uncultured Leptolyngbya sp.]